MPFEFLLRDSQTLAIKEGFWDGLLLSSLKLFALIASHFGRLADPITV